MKCSKVFRITSYPGQRKGGYHKGLDIVSKQDNYQRLFIRYRSKLIKSKTSKTAGNYVVFKTPIRNGYLMITCMHLRRRTIKSVIEKGGYIGTIGWTGSVIPRGFHGRHLHIEVVLHKNGSTFTLSNLGIKKYTQLICKVLNKLFILSKGVK